MNALINGLLKMLGRLLGENIKLHFEANPHAVWVEADAGMLEQVVMNLCINARDAMPRGGALTLRTSLVERTAQSPQLHSDARPGSFVCLAVEDTGCGMDESILHRIFEPFFTTKEVGKGTGLGLATVYGIVKQHEGWIEVDSALGKGSTFRIYFPALPQPVGDPASVEGAKIISGGDETILFVEDDASLRRASSLCLRKLGYAVLEAANGPEALNVWSRHKEKIQLLLTDMVMPETMTGLELAERLKQDKADLRVIICSGYSMDLLRTHPLDPSITLLAKPYQPAALARATRECLDLPKKVAP